MYICTNDFLITHHSMYMVVFSNYIIVIGSPNYLINIFECGSGSSKTHSASDLFTHPLLPHSYILVCPYMRYKASDVYA